MNIHILCYIVICHLFQNIQLVVEFKKRTSPNAGEISLLWHHWLCSRKWVWPV